MPFILFRFIPKRDPALHIHTAWAVQPFPRVDSAALSGCFLCSYQILRFTSNWQPFMPTFTIPIKRSVVCHNIHFSFRLFSSNSADGSCRVFAHILRNTSEDFYCYRKVSPHHSSVPYTFCIVVKWQLLSWVLKMHVYLSLPMCVTVACINLSCLKVQKDYAAVKC